MDAIVKLRATDQGLAVGGGRNLVTASRDIALLDAKVAFPPGAVIRSRARM
jgi:hypothetical protein